MENCWLPVLFVLFMGVGLLQIYFGYLGIEYHMGQWWAGAALLAAFFLRIMLPITIGTYFGAVDVMGWDWYFGLILAAPGLLFVVPAFVTTALQPLLSSGSKTSIVQIDETNAARSRLGIPKFRFTAIILSLVISATFVLMTNYEEIINDYKGLEYFISLLFGHSVWALGFPILIAITLRFSLDEYKSIWVAIVVFVGLTSISFTGFGYDPALIRSDLYYTYTAMFFLGGVCIFWLFDSTKKVEYLDDTHAKQTSFVKENDLENNEVLGPRSGLQRETNQAEGVELNEKIETKACPFCAETIKAGAIKCRYCHERLA